MKPIRWFLSKFTYPCTEVVRLKHVRLGVFVLVLPLLLTASGFAGQKTSVATGVWNNPAIWSPSGVPTSTDTVAIVGGFTVTVDIPGAQCALLTIGRRGDGNGTLTFGSSQGLTVTGSVTLAANATSGPQATGTINMATGATLTCASLVTGTGTATYNLNAGTIVLTGTSSLPTGATTFNNLTISSGTTTLSAAITVNGNLTIGGSGALDVSTSNFGITLKGNWTNSGIFTPRSGTVTLSGTTLQTMSGSTFKNLTIANDSGVTLLTDERVDSILTFTSGKITTGVKNLIIGPTGTVAGASALKYVFGNLQKILNTGAQAFTFVVGDSLFYTPVTVSFVNVNTGGSLTVNTTRGEHPNITTSLVDSSKDVNRYWTLARAGGLTFSNYNATFNFVGADTDVASRTSNYVVKRFNGSSWFATSTGTRASTSTQATGVDSTGDFAVGEPTTVTIRKFLASSPTDTSSTTTKSWGLRLKSGSSAGPIVDTVSVADGSYFACEADSGAVWIRVGYKVGSDPATASTDTCAQVTVTNGQGRTVRFWNFKQNKITINKLRSFSATDTSSTTPKEWVLKLRTGSSGGGAVKTTSDGTLDTLGLANGTYYACEVDSASPWVHVGVKASQDSTARISTDTCVTVAVSNGQTKTVKFWNFKRNQVTISKFQSSSGTDTGSAIGKPWVLKLKSGTPAGAVVGSGVGSTLNLNSVADGTYFACEVDSGGWSHVGYKVDDSLAVVATDSCRPVTVSDGQSRTVRFWNFKVNSITVRKFRATSTADSSTTLPITWFLKLKSGSPTDGGVVLNSGTTTSLVTQLDDGTYSVCEADSSGWSHQRSQVVGSPTRPFATNPGDTCIQVAVSAGSSRTVNFWNFRQNRITVQKLQATSPTDTSSASSRPWFLKIKNGVATGGGLTVATSTTGILTVNTDSLPDGTYSACEADSGASWKRVGNKLDSQGALINTDTCVTVSVVNGQNRTVKFWNFRRNRITVQKFSVTSPGDSSTSTPKSWGLKLKSGSATGGVVASGSVNTLSVNTDSLPDGTYYACEVDSAGWSHTRSQVDNNPTKAFAIGDTCIDVSVSNGQSRTVRLWNFKRNAITVQKFRATSTTDSSTSNLRTWRLKLKSGSIAGDVVKEADLNTLTVDSLADGTYFACEADSTPGWSHTRSQVVGSPTKVFSTADTCIQVTVNGGQSRSVRFWNFHQNRITVQKFQTSSPTDSSTSNPKSWRLKLKSGAVTGGVVRQADVNALIADSLADGTYFACEADSSGWTHVRSQLDGNATKVFAAGDTCIQVAVSDGANRTVRFWNSPPSTITIQKFQATSSTDTTSTSPKSWRLLVRTGSATGGAVNQADATTLTTSGLADGNYFACEADSGGWVHIGNKLDSDSASLNGNNCVTVSVASGQSRTVKFWNFKTNSITVRKFRATSASDTSSTIGKKWRLKIKSGSEIGSTIAEGDTSVLTILNQPVGTYFACEVDSGGWTHVGYKVDASAAFISTDTCRQVVLSGGEAHTVRFWNFHRNTITVQKFQGTSTTDSSTGNPKDWGLKLKRSSATGTLVASGTSNTLTVNADSLSDGTYFACEADSTPGWSHTRSQVDNNATKVFAAGDTCISVTVSDGQNRTIRFWNFKPNRLTVQKFSSASASDTSSTTPKSWRLKLKVGSEAGTTIKQLTATSLDSLGLSDGTYFACEVDSATQWLHVGLKVVPDSAARISTDTCVAVSVQGGQLKTVRFWNYKLNTVIIQKFQSSSQTDTSLTVPKAWFLKLKTGGAAGTAINTSATGALTVNGLGDGTYTACEVDSVSPWVHLARKLDASPVVFSSTDTCVDVALSNSATRTVRFWNFKPNRVIIRKFRSSTSTDVTSSTPKSWRLKLKLGAINGTVIMESDTDSLDVPGLGDQSGQGANAYFACEVDSAGWTHVGNKLDNATTVTNADTCIKLGISGGQTRTVKFWNFFPNRITIKKFEASSNTDTNSTLAKTWRLQVRSGTPTGPIVSQADTSSLDTVKVGDGTFYACEVDSAGWAHIGHKLDSDAAFLDGSNCVQVLTSGGGQSRTVRFWNLKSNQISILKFQGTSSADTSVTTPKSWRLRLRSGSETGDIIKEVDNVRLDTVGLTPGTYYACEVDSSGWLHSAYRVDAGPAVFSSTDTCIALTISGTDTRQVTFWNWKPNRILIQKFQSTSSSDFSLTRPKTWRLKLKTGSVTGGSVAQADTSLLNVGGLANGNYFACEVDSASPWRHVGRQLDAAPTPSIPGTDTCVTVSVSNGQTRTVKFWNFKPNRIRVEKYQASSTTDTSSTVAYSWRLKLKAGSRTGTIVQQADDVAIDTLGLNDGTYFACEADSSAWIHVAQKLDSGPATLTTDTCAQVVASLGQPRTVKFWNFKGNSLTIKKFQGFFAADTASTTAKSWRLKLKTGSRTGTVIKQVTATRLDTINLAAGTYFACEVDSVNWTHVGNKLDNNAAVLSTDTCVAVVMSPEQASVVSFWNRGNAGAPTQIRVETAPDGSGIIVPAQNVPALVPMTVYAVSRDNSNNFVANDSGSWSLQNITGGVVGSDLVAASNGKSAVFTGHIIGSAQIRVVKSGLTSVNSGTLTVVGGQAKKVQVETAANGSGTIVPSQSIPSGLSVTGFAITRDSLNNFLANVPAFWFLDNQTGGVVDEDLVPSGDGKSAIFTGRGIGSAQMLAFSALPGQGGVPAIPSGTITVVSASFFPYVYGWTGATTLAGDGNWTANLLSGAANWTFSSTGGRGDNGNCVTLSPNANSSSARLVLSMTTTGKTFSGGQTFDFYLKRAGTQTTANVFIEYSTDGGSSWNRIDSIPYGTASANGSFAQNRILLPAGMGNQPSVLLGVRITGTGSGSSFANATFDDVYIQIDPPTQYVVRRSRSTPTAGDTVTITGQLSDANNNPVFIGGRIVTWSKTGTGGSFASPTSTGNADGLAKVVFTTSTTVGTVHTVTATDNFGLTGTSGAITTQPGPAAKYIVTSSRSNPIAGDTVTIRAQLADVNNNSVKTSGKIVTWSKTGTGGSFASATSTTDTGGVAIVVFTTSTTAGTVHTVTATDNTSLTGTSGNITTQTGPAAKYVVTSSRTNPTAGDTVTIKAQLADINNNPVSTSGKTVTWSSTNGGSFSSPTSLTNASGIAQVVFTTSSTPSTVHTVTATDGDGFTGTSGSITTVAAGATRTWKGANGTQGVDWSRTANWVEGVVPTANDNVIIPTAGVFQYPVLDVAAVGQSLTIQTGATITASTNSITVSGAVALQGTGSITGAQGLILSGTANAALSAGTGTISKLRVNKTGGAAVNLGSDVTITDTLNFVSGNIVTGANKVILTSTCLVTRTSGHVVGNLQKNVATGATSRTFEIGDATNYTPVAVSFGSVTVAGNLTASTTPSKHPDIDNSGINSAKGVNRYWTLTNSGVTFTNYSAVYNFVAGDVDAGASTGNFIVAKKDAGGWSLPTVGARTSTSTSATGMTTFSDFAIGEPSVFANLKVFLEGPYAGASTMNDSLRLAGVIPLKQPYNTAPWNFAGTDSVPTIPTNSVDWILVELRTGTSSATKVATRAAFVKKDGSVVNPSGAGPVQFGSLGAASYYIVITHRNHLSIMSAAPVPLSTGSPLYDFTTAQSKAYGVNPMKALSGGVFGMLAGDADGNGQIQNSDVVFVIHPSLGQSGYKKGDTNLSGQVSLFDIDSYCRPNLGRATQVPP